MGSGGQRSPGALCNRVLTGAIGCGSQMDPCSLAPEERQILAHGVSRGFTAEER